MSAMLWCLHIYGPDDIHPAPSKAHAEAAALLFNASEVSARAAANDVLMVAVTEPYPYSPESHAEAAPRFMENWIIPRNYRADIDPAPAAPAEQQPTAAPDGQRWSSDGEHFPHETLAELCEYNTYAPGDVVYVGNVVQHHPSLFFSAAAVIEDALNSAADVGGEFAEDYLDEVTAEDRAALNDMLLAWAAKFPIRFYGITNQKEHVITAEDLA